MGGSGRGSPCQAPQSHPLEPIQPNASFEAKILSQMSVTLAVKHLEEGELFYLLFPSRCLSLAQTEPARRDSYVRDLTLTVLRSELCTQWILRTVTFQHPEASGHQPGALAPRAALSLSPALGPLAFFSD